MFVKLALIYLLYISYKGEKISGWDVDGLHPNLMERNSGRTGNSRTLDWDAIAQKELKKYVSQRRSSLLTGMQHNLSKLGRTK